MPISGREAALKALIEYRRSGTRSDLVTDKIIQKEKMEKREAALFYRITMGVIQNIALCDFYIEHFLKSGIKKLQPVVLDILRLSVYQIIFLNRIPNSAAVNEGVKLAKKHSNRAASGLVNAVLRRIAENSDKLPQVKGKDETETLSIKYSHPEQLVDYLILKLGMEGAEEFLRADNEIAPVMIRTNLLKTNHEELIKALEKEGIEFEAHSWLNGFFELKEIGGLEELTLFREGLFTVQDPASALTVMAGGLKKDMNVLDCCAAPGGKTFMASQIMGNSGSILSCDLYENKLGDIKKGAERLGIRNVKCKTMDASVLYESLFKSFDVIICDAPCSGFGVIAKKPEIRYKTFESVSKLPQIQLSILKNVSKYLKTGGTLMYSTCTIMENENEGVVKSFLSEREDFILEPFVLPEPIGIAEKGYITLWPHIHHTDGFFIAKLKKVK